MQALRESLSKLNLAVLAILVGVALLTTVYSSAVNPTHDDAEWWSGWLQNFSTEMYGAVITFILFELVIGAQLRREDKVEAERQREQDRIEAEQQRKQDALRLDTLREAVTEAVTQEMRRIQQAQAITRLRQAEIPEARQLILDEMRTLDLLQDAHLLAVKLGGVDLRSANLSSANLEYANLSGAHLHKANLSGANLRFANLSGSDLEDANLQSTYMQDAVLTSAILTGANLSDAILRRASLSGAHLWATDLSGAHLWNTNLARANVEGAIFTEDTTLPDNTRWTPSTDMSRFTDPNHPNFWRPEPGSVWWYPKTDE